MLHSGSFPRHRDPLNAHWVHGCYWVHSARCWQARDVEQAILQSGHTRVFGLALMVGNGHTLQNGVSTIYHNLLGMTVWPSHTRGWVQSWPEQSKFSFLVCRSITKTNKGAIVLHLSTNEQRRHLSTECWTLTAAVPPWLSCPCGWSTTWGSPSQLFVLDDPWNPQVVSTLGEMPACVGAFWGTFCGFCCMFYMAWIHLNTVQIFYNLAENFWEHHI